MVSRVSTGQYFDNSTTQLTSLQNNLSKTETQLSTSLNIVNPSDAPDKASLVNKLNTQIAQQADYNNTLNASNQFAIARHCLAKREQCAHQDERIDDPSGQ